MTLFFIAFARFTLSLLLSKLGRRQHAQKSSVTHVDTTNVSREYCVKSGELDFCGAEKASRAKNLGPGVKETAGETSNGRT